MIDKIKEYIKNIISELQKPVVSILPGQLAFSFILTIIPTLILIAMVANLFGLSLGSIAEFITKSFPKAVSDMLVPLIQGKGFDLSILFFLVMAIWLASTGAFAVMTASDVIYNVKPKKYVPKKAKSILITFMLILLVLVLLVLLAFGGIIINWVKSLGVFNDIIGYIETVYITLKYPLTFIIIYYGIKLVYTIAPNKLITSKSVTIGSIFTTIMWIIVTAIYSTWVNNAHYDIFYGSISNIIVLLIWTWLLAYIFTIGLIINKDKDK